MDSLLEYVVKMGASDLHIASGVAPTMRVNGELVTIPDTPTLSCEMAEYLVQSMMSLAQWDEFQREWELDFSFGRRGLGRYRVGAFRERGDASAVLRRVPAEAAKLEDLGLPKSVGTFAWLNHGLVLVTGPSGSGKSTTLTAIIDKINHDRNVHVITIEDPIEFVHTHDKAIVQQRELGKDTTSFARALRSALREDPDVLLIGEMRDTETISATVSAAETGHLVFATLHTNSAAQSIDRIVDSFPPHQQTQIRLQLASSLAGIVSQRLIPTAKGSRICVAEVLIVNGAVRNLIREGKAHQIDNVMQAGIKDGMVIFDMRLAELVRSRVITREIALTYAMDPRSFESRLRA
ncbi:MAG: type IV pilus twitching motility protein PilT [Coriobacteriia bacterium]|nr:type IV pilus twitching motility protein PilT [Coriobacteriia bacterium]